MISAASRAACAIRCASGASSRAPSSARRRKVSKRTPHRKDFAIPPPPGTILDCAAAAHREVVSIGKIGDIFAHRNTGQERKGAGNMAHFDMMLAALAELADGGLIFVNFLDFDTDYGHRRDVAGYAHCLEQFDARLPELFAALKAGRSRRDHRRPRQ